VKEAETSVVRAEVLRGTPAFSFLEVCAAMSAQTGWMRAEAAGDLGPWRQQAILGRRIGCRCLAAISCANYVIEHLADDDASSSSDETGFLSVQASCVVGRQYTKNTQQRFGRH